MDIPLFQALFEKFRVKMIVVDPQKTYPIEKAIPNKETIEAIEEGKKLIEKHKKGLKSAEELFNEILSEDEWYRRTRRAFIWIILCHNI